MRRILLAVGLAALTFGTLMAIAGPAGAASAKGCGGNATSFDSDGKQQDSASAPGPGGTKDNPFDVWADGTVKYHYEIDGSGAGSWDLKIQKTPITFGNDIHADSAPSGDGTRKLDQDFEPGGVSLPGLYKVDIKGDRGGTACVVSGWIHVHGSLVKSPVFWLGIIFLLLGLGMFFPLLRP
jgi:hypothetical protein